MKIIAVKIIIIEFSAKIIFKAFFMTPEKIKRTANKKIENLVQPVKLQSKCH